MFIRKVAQKTFSKKKSKNKKNNVVEQSEAPPTKIEEPIYFDEPEAGSVESSEVEYIEDDDDYAKIASTKVVSKKAAATKVVTPTRATPPQRPVKPPISQGDALLALSVVVPPKSQRQDGDSSCFSQDGGVLTKLPPHLVHKKGHHHHSNNSDTNMKIESKPSMTTSTTSEEHLTQVTASASENTMSESGSASGIVSIKNESRNKRRLETWKNAMEAHVARHGKKDPATVGSLQELGSLYMRFEQFEAARDYFARALDVSESIYDRRDLRMAKALELYGMAECSCVKLRQDQWMLNSALSCLDVAFSIRYEKLGPTHVDTVETLNKIARIQMRKKSFCDARDSYFEVLKMREAIFGKHHPCVAVSAHALATAHARLLKVEPAKFYLHQALQIYEHNGLGHHSFADAIRKDLYDLKFIKMRRFEV